MAEETNIIGPIALHQYQHNKNSGFGNHLFCNFLARALSIEYDQPLLSWLHTKICTDKDHYDRLDNDDWGNSWAYIDHNYSEGEISLVAGDHDFGYGTWYHQNEKSIKLVKKHRESLLNDFGKRDGVFAHIRLGDLLPNTTRICDYEYYRRCLSGLGPGYITSDSPNEYLVQLLLSEFDLELYEGTPEETIIFGSMFENKVLSMGTFSWAIGFIGNQNNVIHPSPEDYENWHGPLFELMENWNPVSRPYE